MIESVELETLGQNIVINHLCWAIWPSTQAGGNNAKKNSYKTSMLSLL